jgi:hypothetical protein
MATKGSSKVEDATNPYPTSVDKSAALEVTETEK